MKVVTWEDRRGYRHRSIVRDNDDETAGPGGILQDPPDVDGVDWDTVKRELHNRLVDEGLVTWGDVQRGQNRITGIVQAVLKNRIVQLYRKEKEVENG